MTIKQAKNEIIIEDAETFDIVQSLTCGQIFRYELTENRAIVYETNQKIEIIKEDKVLKIKTKSLKKHLNYFDLLNDYDKINERVSKISPLIEKAAHYGKGIRIFKQDFLETTISFVISANNNIPRIQKTLKLLCEKFGDKKTDYYAFPSLYQLEKITEQDFKNLGTGYRAPLLVRLIKQLKTFKPDLTLLTKNLRKSLLKLSGVGPKVADCILLFSLNRSDVFPTDTWIKKVYKQDLGGKKENAKEISESLAEQFKSDSGIIQQYLFYYKRSKGDL